jgi:hypothetical protein
MVTGFLSTFSFSPEKKSVPPEAFLPSAGLPFVLTQKEAKSQEASKSCPSDHSAVSARAREACASEKPSFSLPKLLAFRLGYGANR